MDEEERRGRSVWSERGAPAGKEELITDYGFSVWDDEKVLEMNRGDGRTTVRRD